LAWKTNNNKMKKIKLGFIFRNNHWKLFNEFSGARTGEINNPKFLIYPSKKVNYTIRREISHGKPMLMVLTTMVDIETERNFIIDAFEP
jgi:hypothetical protein